MKNSIKLTAVALVLGLVACQKKNQTENQQTPETSSTQSTATMNITKEPFGQLSDSTSVDLYTLTNTNGATVKITNYGSIVTSIQVPDQNGKPGEVVLGFDQLEKYLTDEYIQAAPYFGAIVGRYGNRIAKGRFTLDGKSYTLATTNGPNHLHGGVRGFDRQVWQAKEIKNDSTVGLQLTYVSKDGEEGYPGTLRTVVTYTLTKNNELRIDYRATTDKPTVVNLTNHSYFNLAHGIAQDALGHQVTLPADRYIAVNNTLIPTGDMPSVKGTLMDFTSPHTIGEHIEEVEGGGYDHTFVLNRTDQGLSLAARVTEPTTGRVMEVLTDQPGIQFYTGNFLKGNLVGHGGQVYRKHYGFCLETQHFPDSPNQPAFPSVVLRPGETYTTTTVYRFSTQK